MMMMTCHDVGTHDLHVVVAVGARVFVPEPDHVTQLVHHYAELVAVLADGDRLRSVAALADERAAPETHNVLERTMVGDCSLRLFTIPNFSISFQSADATLTPFTFDLPFQHEYSYDSFQNILYILVKNILVALT